MNKDFIKETMKSYDTKLVSGEFTTCERGDHPTAQKICNFDELKFRNFLEERLQSQRTEMLRRLPEGKRAFNGSVLGKKEQFRVTFDEGWNAALAAVRESLSA